MKKALGLVGVVLGCAAVQVWGQTKAPKAERAKRSGAPSAGPATTQFQIRNVNFRIDESITLEIAWLRGELLSNEPGKLPTFDDKASLLMKIDAGEVAMSTASFTDLMNRYVFNYPGAPLTNIRVSTEGDLLRQEATMHNTVPTEMVGSLAALPDGRIRFRPNTIRAAGVPAKKLMDAVGLQTSKLVKGTDPRGVDIVGDDLIMDLNVLMPPPRVRAKVSGVRIEGDRIVQTFGGKDAAAAREELAPPDKEAANYMYYRGGTIRFRKFIMEDTDVQIVDADPGDPLDYSLERYFDQIVAGQSRNTSNGAQVTSVPDYHDLQRRGSSEQPAP
ncbi:MAG TPA: hypothetical protein VK993_04310 [Chthoniobacterales bacterium]|nr:hypothetical protein [Chthoniobacterales bacterium]